MNQERIGKFIAKCRKEKGLTQEVLAEKLGTTSKSISRWENGNTMPDISIYNDLATIFGVSVIELFNGERMSKDEIKGASEESILKILLSKNAIENMQILVEILILIGIIISTTITLFVAKDNIHRIITLACGSFVWGYGIFLRVKLRKILNLFDVQNLKEYCSQEKN